MEHSVGDQHKSNNVASANPFEEEPPRMSEYTAQEIATLQSRLEKQLGPEYISSRPGAAGQKVHYLAAEKVINLANEVFGFNGWSSAIKVITIDFIDENPQNGKISLGLSVTVRVTLRDGTYHEDIGYGHIENCKGKAAAFEKAKKEGTTDGLKRALRTFGNVLGNCIYDKDFLGKVTKIKIAPSRWDADNLHRHPDFAPIKRELPQEESVTSAAVPNGDASHTEGDDEFGAADFSDADFSENHNGHPDEVILSAEPQLPPAPVRSVVNTSGPARVSEQRRPSVPHTNGTMNTPSKPPQARMSAPSADHRAQQASLQRNPSHEHRPLPGQQAANIKADTAALAPSAANASGGTTSSPDYTSQHLSAPQPGAVPTQHFARRSNQQLDPPVAFFSARAAQVLNGAPDSPAVPVPQFNPHAESPSIRKTTGIDHSRSVPVKRASMGVAEQAAGPLPAFRENMPAPQAPARDFVNPSLDQHRRIGAPSLNGSAYRPPTRRGPMDPNSGMAASASNNAQAQAPLGPAGVKRPPLGDVSNMHPSNTYNPSGGSGEDAKRQRTMGPESIAPPQQNLPGAR
jgi:DNA repair and recombination protein RAD52